MPYVNIKITDEGVTREQKKQLIAGVTELLQKTLGKNPKSTTVVIDEIHVDNWGMAGLQVPEYRESLKQS
ncbi:MULTISPECIES: 2-hydroxymuconate tautomerase family protein [Burkholderia]|jgi:4-oxalocrotonate tautomerase|uniref:Tautomerase n=1 Tax=Burkholderia plantarii TaxID=41899 RepID=A0A0B6RI04_BURPL|nr:MULTISPECIES: 4-oxalocrotonate tautomerase family protein [Burkholderia]AJK44957.1 4-oxalocrotonate tautomerase [Burkholderia plantarii]ALK29234.1 4-oxalocrotonate tautomerase [Burkholderia plantarii]MBI0326447.1 4-oxalocrotonate tautomerase family protein [Burkholderia plantarii]WLE57941.1 4-oxalocrotonate tautomerase family protein [Burkholderia plantarii]GLZ21037.1 tautomerase [Burkholderia plantarii]